MKRRRRHRYSYEPPFTFTLLRFFDRLFEWALYGSVLLLFFVLFYPEVGLAIVGYYSLMVMLTLKLLTAGLIIRFRSRGRF